MMVEEPTGTCVPTEAKGCVRELLQIGNAGRHSGSLLRGGKAMTTPGQNRFLRALLLSIGLLAVPRMTVGAVFVTGTVSSDVGDLEAVDVRAYEALSEFQQGKQLLSDRRVSGSERRGQWLEPGRFEVELPNVGMWWIVVSAADHVTMAFPLFPAVADVQLPELLLPSSIGSCTVKVMDVRRLPLEAFIVSGTAAPSRASSGSWVAWRPAVFADEVVFSMAAAPADNTIPLVVAALGHTPADVDCELGRTLTAVLAEASGPRHELIVSLEDTLLAGRSPAPARSLGGHWVSPTTRVESWCPQEPVA